MDACCNLGREFLDKKNIIAETENFFVVPTLGQMGIEGYIMVCSKVHYRGVGGMPEHLFPELDSLVSHSRERLSDIYKSDTIAFEHGPKINNFNGGSCIEHAHLHIVPVEDDITALMLEDLSERLEMRNRLSMERIKDYSVLAEIFNRQETSYMSLEDTIGRRFAVEVNFLLPSQYLRMIISYSSGKSDWNWKENPGYGLFQRSVDFLKERF